MKLIKVENVRRVLAHFPGNGSKTRVLLDEFRPELLEQAVRRAIRDVPYYKDYGRYLEGGFDITKFPIISKADIKGKTDGLVSRRVPSFLRFHKRTAGSTGTPLDVFYSPRLFIEKDLVVHHLFNSIGKNLRIASLRRPTPEGTFMQSVGNHHYVFSPYALNPGNFEAYIAEMKRLRINCLHVYPTTVTIFARLIRDRYGVSPIEIKGIVASSESFCREDKQMVMKVFPSAKIIDLYGHNEIACFASADGLEPFRFYQNFGYVELRDSGERTADGNRVCEIVATSIVNRTMPLIRYATRDFVEIDGDGRVLNVLGRSTDFLVTKNGTLLPCMFRTRDESLANVLNRQYWQPEPGKLIKRLVVNDRYTEADRQLMIEDMRDAFGDLVDCDVEIVDHIDVSAMGKQQRMQQDVDLTPYR